MRLDRESHLAEHGRPERGPLDQFDRSHVVRVFAAEQPRHERTAHSPAIQPESGQRRVEQFRGRQVVVPHH